MSAYDFVEAFKVLHAKLKAGSLTPDERARYHQSRLQLSRMVIASQQLGHAGQTLRSTLRMAKMLKVEVEHPGAAPMRGSTIDLATGGFAMLMPTALSVDKACTFTLHLSRGAGAEGTPIAGPCKVASCRPQGALFRVSFRFENLPPAVEEQLSVALIDALLERFSQ